MRQAITIRAPTEMQTNLIVACSNTPWGRLLLTQRQNWWTRTARRRIDTEFPDLLPTLSACFVPAEEQAAYSGIRI